MTESIILKEAREQLGWDYFTLEQQNAFDYWMTEIYNELPNPDRGCVYFPTGKGKTAVLLVMVKLRGRKSALVLAPPATHPEWKETAAKLGIEVTVISHAKWRMKDFKPNRDQMILVDEFHLLGGQTGIGWKKFDRVARALRAPIAIASATPSYNDVERVYCVAHVIDPGNHSGGYQGWLFEHCITEHNPFGSLPKVVSPKEYKTAEEFLAALPGVMYIPDDAPDILHDRRVNVRWLDHEDLGLELDHRRGRIMASAMEQRQYERRWKTLDERGELRNSVASIISASSTPKDKVIIFSASSTIAKAVARFYQGTVPVVYVDGSITQKQKEQRIQEFRTNPEVKFLVGTASIATGTDGLDRVCDTMIIVDDTDDDSLRRQLLGRILSRGIHGTNEDKVAYRLQYI